MIPLYRDDIDGVATQVKWAIGRLEWADECLKGSTGARFRRLFWRTEQAGAVPGILSMGFRNSGGVGGAETPTPTTLTKLLELHDYHKCHSSTLGPGTLPPQPQSVTALWPVLIFRPAESRRLSWPEWLVTN